MPLPPMPEGLEAELLEDLESRVSLSDAALPSAVFYTFVNTHQSLNCVSFSSDGAMIAGACRHFLLHAIRGSGHKCPF